MHYKEHQCKLQLFSSEDSEVLSHVDKGSQVVTNSEIMPKDLSLTSCEDSSSANRFEEDIMEEDKDSSQVVVEKF